MSTESTTRPSAPKAKATVAVAFARHSTELEGRRSSHAARTLQDAYIAGELDEDELVERTKALHGIA
jgi:hypothetical protein